MNSFLERIALQRAEEQAKAEAARWRAESLAAAAGRPLCPCGRVIKQRTGPICYECAQRARDKARHAARMPLSTYLRTRRTVVSVEDVMDALDITRDAAGMALSRAVRSGRAVRVAPGRYLSRERP